MNGIIIDKLVKKWGETYAVDGVSFQIPENSLTVLLGPSGCGKSTILRMIAGLEEVTSGQISINGKDITRLDASKRGVSMVFQTYALFPHLSVRENILFGLKVRKIPAEERNKRLMDAAKMVGLDDLLDRKPANLSGGQRQRVALSRTIVSNQPVCLMDEPLSNLDAKLRAEMREEILGLQRKLSLTMIYVTHDQIEAMSMADQVVLLRDGKIEQVSTPSEMYEKPATTFVAAFLGLPPMNILKLEHLKDLHKEYDFIPSAPQGWKLGIRPENIFIVNEGGLKAEVLAVDYMGAETVLRVKLAKNELQVRINGRVKTLAGDAINIAWKMDDTHLFDKDGVRRGSSEKVQAA